MKYRLGDLLTLSDERNSELAYRLDSLRGISIQKVFIDTKADMSGVSLTNYLLVKPGCFAYVTITSRNGGKITIAHNDTDQTYIVSSSYIVFWVHRPDLLNSDFLFMFFNRAEFDRYARFNSWGSAREAFSWDDMCSIMIDLPPLPTQRKYVAVYRALLANQRVYENSLKELRITCDAYIEQLMRTTPRRAIGKYVFRHDHRNYDNSIKNVRGISVSKEFRIPTSKVNVEKLENYKIVAPRQIAFVQTTHNEKVFAFAFNNTQEDIVVSSVNEVFSTDETHLLPEYLAMFFNRREFDRYARYHSWGSARETFTWSDLCEVKIPMPGIRVQQAIVDIFNAYIRRREMNDTLKAQLKRICPILIKGALEHTQIT